jgi:hypothetical protein
MGPGDNDDYANASRQQKINEYAYQNKMDTLFFFQIVLLSVLIVGIFAYGARVGYFSYALTTYVGILLLVVDIVVLAGRMAYSMNLRDTSSWSRRRFAYENGVPDAPPEIVLPKLPKFDLSGIDLSGIDMGQLCATYKSK